MWSVKKYSTHKFVAIKEGIQRERYQTQKKLQL